MTDLAVKPEHGLTTTEAKSRLAKVGPNALKAAKPINPFKLFFTQFKDVLVIVLLISAAVSFGLSFIEGEGNDELTESILIFVIVIAIAVIGFLNEYKAEKTVEALRKLVGQTAKVRRDGKEQEIDAVDLVPGDIILFSEGQKVPADVRLYLVRSLQVNEASLTGESVPVSKNTLVLNKTAALGDQRNMVFSGTIITTGVGEGVVVETGQKTQIGHIAKLVNEVETEQTPMQKKLDVLGKRLGTLILGICALVFVVVFFADRAILDEAFADRLIFAFTVAVALAVAAIPEGLSFVVRISLALGARRMAARKALVRKLSAVEALGSTDVICSDKTGTLTRGEMTVRQVWVGQANYGVEGNGYEITGYFSAKGKATKPNDDLLQLLRVGALCNNAALKSGASISGDPTEAAMLVSAAKADFHQEALAKDWPRVDELPFSSERKRMTTVHQHDHSYLVASKGAPDVLLNYCDRILINGQAVKLTAELKREVLEANQALAKQALRVLGMAYKEVKTKPGSKSIESELIFIGLQGLMDPPRKEVKEVIARVQNEAGMKVIMITGDYIETAKAVAAEINIKGEAITGLEMDELTQEQFEAKVNDIGIYARVNPEHKIRIVQALKKYGHQVAMTGDGVNDAPAIKAADIGIAMGITGTDATKEAADLILLDDQFLTIINAIEEGRGIFDNVRKFVAYLLGANIAEVALVFGGMVILQDPIMTATQLLFINIVTDGLPAVALGSDPAESNIMRYHPSHFQDAIINKRMWIEMFVFGLTAGALCIWQFALMRGADLQEAVSAIFVAIVIYELVRLVVLRSNYKIPWFSNPWLTVAIISSVLVQLAAVYYGPIARLFEVKAVNSQAWLFVAGGSVALFVIMKITRRILTTMIPEVAASHRLSA